MTAEEQIRREEAIDDVGILEESADPAEDTPMLDEVRDTPPIPIKGPKGKRGKPKGRKPKEPVAETETEQTEEGAEVAEEPAEEDPVKTEEQRKAKKEASSLYDGVAKTFRVFKERLLSERLTSLKSELDLLAQPECIHPEYLKQVACVDARLQKQTREAHAYYRYKLQSIRDRTIGDRAQLHSQYFQHVRQTREDVLYNLGEQWYAIQKERRQSHQQDSEGYLYKYDPERSVQLRRQAKYNLEVSVLSGVAKYVGFPAAPEIEGTLNDDVDGDFKKMKVSSTRITLTNDGRRLMVSLDHKTCDTAYPAASGGLLTRYSNLRPVHAE